MGTPLHKKPCLGGGGGGGQKFFLFFFFFNFFLLAKRKRYVCGGGVGGGGGGGGSGSGELKRINSVWCIWKPYLEPLSQFQPYLAQSMPVWKKSQMMGYALLMITWLMYPYDQLQIMLCYLLEQKNLQKIFEFLNLLLLQ